MSCARILTIAGSDSGGGAGIQADIKVITMLGGHAMSAVTAVTAQNTQAVQAVHLLAPTMVRSQMQSVVSDIGVDAIKIGMVGNAAIAATIADYLEELCADDSHAHPLPIVFDPVITATSGAELADSQAVDAFERLLRLASVATPNLPELAALGGEKAVLGHGCALLIKGGHAAGAVLCDHLVTNANSRAWLATDTPKGAVYVWRGSRIDTRYSHGTGCCLASAIATGLGQGMGLVDATSRARAYVRQSLRLATALGKASGAMVHQPLGEDWQSDPDLAPRLASDSAVDKERLE